MSRFKMKEALFRLFVLFLPALGVFSFSELSFITEPCHVTVLPNDPALLDCQAHGQPPVTIKWFKNGAKLAESQHFQFLSNGSLFIPKTTHTKEESDEGVYQCLSQNKYGAILSQRSRLTIASISEFVLLPVPVVATEGSVARFSCSVSSSPTASITWEFNHTTLPLQTERITVLPNGVLQIHNVQQEDSGQYGCVATNIGSRLKSRTATLTVNKVSGPKPRQRPRIIAGPQNTTVSLHQTAVLECVATGNPRPIISWSRADSKPIDVYKAKVLGNGNLVITDVSSKHSGVYVCRATTPGTRNHSTAAANVTVLVPPTIVEKPESQTRPRAGTARFMCRAEGIPEPRISWLKNGEEVHLNGRIKMYNSKLVITQITPEDDAIYQCVAESEQGSVLSLARLIVVMSEDRPSAPRNIHAETISSSAILLAWERPLYNANKVIAYSIHYMKAEGLNNEEYQVVIGNDTTSYIIDDLEPARNYSFYIVAYMPMGASRMSDQVSQHTLEDVPLRTPELSLTSNSSTNIQVRWQPLPAKLSRGQVSAYRLWYRTAAQSTLVSVELLQNSTEYLLEGLQPDTIYLLRMAAATRVGWCEPSAWSSHRTPRTSSSKVPLAPVLQLEPLNCTSIVARWQTSAESVAVLGYQMCYHEEGQPEQPTIQLQAQDRSYTISGLDPRKKYHVKILAMGKGGDGYQTDQTMSTPGCVSARDQLAAAPSPPHQVTVLASNWSTVTLRWSRPVFPSGNTVSFTVRCTPVGTHIASTIHYLQTTKQSVTVEKLLPNTRYEFVVRLHVDQMSSPWSPAVYHQTAPAAPSRPPAGLRVTLIEDDTALVSWKEASDPSDLVTHYTIMYASHKAWMDGHWQQIQREGTHTMALLEKLEPGNTYLVKISASNRAGDGPFSSTVELSLRRANKTPRHSDSFTETVFSDGLYHIDQRSMTGIIVGVSIALACIVTCALILISKGRPRKSSSHKVVAVGAPHGPHPGRHVTSEHVEALVPMMCDHCLDAEGGSTVVISSTSPPSHNQNQRWLFLNRNVTGADVESRANFYEAGKTVLMYEDRPGSAPLPPSIIYGPPRSESSQSSEGSHDTGDSGHYSNEESNEETNNTSTKRSSRPQSLGPDVVELKKSLQVERDHSSPDHSWPRSALNTSRGSSNPNPNPDPRIVP
ncbi:protogenin A-like [Gouania willdenowi]|uniref:protogenin A-like n=1 Tax=Gouania willdenowi TaxID=441366 RepID=UPI001056D029|nr:protogenin A-like [Gouania willdenowi]